MQSKRAQKAAALERLHKLYDRLEATEEETPQRHRLGAKFMKDLKALGMDVRGFKASRTARQKAAAKAAAMELPRHKRQEVLDCIFAGDRDTAAIAAKCGITKQQVLGAYWLNLTTQRRVNATSI